MARRARDEVDCKIWFLSNTMGAIVLYCATHGTEPLAAAEPTFPTLEELTQAHDRHLTADRTATPKRAKP